MTHANARPSRAKFIVVEKVRRRVLRPLEANAQDAVRQAADYTKVADTAATVTRGAESAVANNSRELVGIDAFNMKDAAAADIKFPLCDAAIRKKEGGEWDLADAISAECPETGEDGERNGSYAKMTAMRDEIAKNHGVVLSFERIRKLRKVASAFPPGRRRPAISLEAHLEAGTPEVLDELIKAAAGTALTRDYVRQQKYPTEKAQQDQQKAERRHQVEDQRTALQTLVRQLEREKEEREQRYIDLCHSVEKEPELFSQPLSPAKEPAVTVAEDLEQGLRGLLLSRGFDPAVT